jgi:hypothetical protein
VKVRGRRLARGRGWLTATATAARAAARIHKLAGWRGVRARSKWRAE